MPSILAILGLLATIIGVVGHTFDNGKPTRLGWSALLIAVIVCGVTIRQSIHDAREQRKKSALAHRQILLDIHAILEPFAVLLVDADAATNSLLLRQSDRNDAILKWSNARREDLDSPKQLEIFSILSDLPEYYTTLNGFTFNDKIGAFALPSQTWAQFFLTNAVGPVKNLNDTMSANRGYLDAETVEAVDDLTNSWLVHRISLLPQTDPDSSIGMFLALDEIRQGEATDNYRKFLAASQRAYKVCREELADEIK